MLVSMIIDPSSFDRDNFDHPGYKEQAEHLLDAIDNNGLLIIDPTQALLKTDLINNIKELPTQIGQYLQTVIAEISKKPKKILKMF